MSTNRIELDPEVEALLRASASRPGAGLLRRPRADEIRRLRLEANPIGLAAAGLAAAESELIRTHRAVVADLLREAGSTLLRIDPAMRATITDFVTIARRKDAVDPDDTRTVATQLVEGEDFGEVGARQGLAALLDSVGGASPITAAELAFLSLRLEPSARALSIAALDLGRRGATRFAGELYSTVLGSPATDEELARASEGFAFLLVRDGRLDQALSVIERGCATRAEFVLPRLNKLVLSALLGRRAEAIAADESLRESLDERSEALHQFVGHLDAQKRAGTWSPTQVSRDVFRSMRGLLGPAGRKVSDVFEATN